MADYFGFNFPFLSETFVLPPQADERIIKNDLKQLLLTSLEERVMRPDFGTGIRTAVFEPDDPTTLKSLAVTINTAIKLFEKRVIFREIKINSDGLGQIEITVFAALSRDPNRILDVTLEFAKGPGINPLPTQQAAI